MKGNIQYLILLLTWVTLMIRSALQSWKWQLIGMILWYHDTSHSYPHQRKLHTRFSQFCQQT